MKIAIIVSSLGEGGAEKSSAILSFLLYNLGFEIHIISILDKIEYPYKGELLNLGILKNKEDSQIGRFKRMLILKKYIRNNNFDWVIDNRTRMSSFSEYVISKYIFNPKKSIYVVRSSKIELYFPKINFIAKKIYANSIIVAVSKGVNTLIKNKFQYKNVLTIYNPINFDTIEIDANAYNVEGKYIIAYGRIDDQVKNYSLLIDAYCISNLIQKNVFLYILGKGKDVVFLKNKVKNNGFEKHIIFHDKMTNPFPFVKNAIATVLTSRFEGFPRVLIESLAVGTPVISVDCETGPREIIKNKFNGLLVENHNSNALADAMQLMVTDTDLYINLKKNAKKSVEHLSMENIAQQWKKVLEKNKT
jgi:glycosyltransferase involved in cell wall biosynthesis